jgi:hypothetical protein
LNNGRRAVLAARAGVCFSVDKLFITRKENRSRGACTQKRLQKGSPQGGFGFFKGLFFVFREFVLKKDLCGLPFLWLFA